MKKVVTLGEIMLRLSPPNFQTIEQAHQFDVVYGGGEANVAISLSRLGLKSEFVSKLPNNPLGASAEHFLNQFGVETNHIKHGEGRLGIYFLEKGYSIRSSKVYYDRTGSVFSQSQLSDYDFDIIFKDADWFHVSGITPALNKTLFEITKKAMQVAKEKGITVSCDLNYRKSLWTFTEARKAMSELIPYTDVCIGIEPLQLLDQMGNDIKDTYERPWSIDDCQEMIREIHKVYPIQMLAMTFRESISANRNRLKTILSDSKTFYESSEIEVEIVDRVGTGDAFAAGLIYALINNYDHQDAIEFATACFALKHTIEGDVNLLQLNDIQRFLTSKDRTSIQR